MDYYNMDLRDRIDATLLKPDEPLSKLVEFGKKSAKEGFRSVVVHPYFVRPLRRYLGDSIRICTVIAFPYGTETKEVKSFEAKDSLNNGADEIDYVISIPSVKSSMYDYIKEEAKSIVMSFRGVIKAIIEVPILSEEELKMVVETLEETDIDYLKTSTGLYRPVTPEDIVKLKTLSNKRIKAAGGIRTKKQAEELIKSGADVLGTSKPFELL
ncbi:MAG: deoxyribose-phosphate aldolase [Thermoproteota archaeon]|nr:MAG: deoxyribose-phosphate aldolase [Candidatus Korarchaeota archaeon]